MIEALGLTKRYGDVLAVDDLSFRIPPGQVTGFLGPNGSGKTTTMRMILGLDRPSAGSVTVNGHRYVDLPVPMREVGAMLDARAVHPRRTAYNHLRCLARSNGIGRSRVDAVLELVGLDGAADTRAGTFSLGMAQRLGIAAALLGDPGVLILDEPANGLDPEGMHWIRGLLRDLAGEGRTVLLSSHALNEMTHIADHLIVIGRGSIVADASTEQLLKSDDTPRVLVRVADGYGESLSRAVVEAGADVRRMADGALLVSGLDSTRISALAAAGGEDISELTPQVASLEETFMRLTGAYVDYRAVAGEWR
ncbi:ABC transporter ATP-binding protein [Phytoactinopolyspora halotolerans]|uniref:ATP-binding cassette domain-containing protein n=1 Tax=Phytoactinopolyspora halotolerans TaxID=1981512 RepID=A0A6L9SFL8_9ACTN|nr:ATP-binding cassette domain-containing protein [Phytoactinopolyspora halotolerans]